MRRPKATKTFFLNIYKMSANNLHPTIQYIQYKIEEVHS